MIFYQLIKIFVLYWQSFEVSFLLYSMFVYDGNRFVISYGMKEVIKIL